MGITVLSEVSGVSKNIGLLIQICYPRAYIPHTDASE